ncbi:MAG: hypothetical protein JWN50_778 [Parcubacteria group bacterium]|nr:hypothetical protein [Parcubacteria group bacterium]
MAASRHCELMLVCFAFAVPVTAVGLYVLINEVHKPVPNWIAYIFLGLSAACIFAAAIRTILRWPSKHPGSRVRST